MNYRKAEVRDLDKVSKLFDQYRLFYGKKTDLKSAKKFLVERISKNDSSLITPMSYRFGNLKPPNITQTDYVIKNFRTTKFYYIVW